MYIVTLNGILYGPFDFDEHISFMKECGGIGNKLTKAYTNENGDWAYG